MVRSKICEIRLPERLLEVRGKESQASFARRLGISQQAYSKYEHGDVLPGAEMIMSICVALGISSDYLLGLVDDPHGTSSGSVISAPNNRGSIAQNSPGATVTSGTDCANCARVLKLQAQLEVLKDLLRKG